MTKSISQYNTIIMAKITLEQYKNSIDGKS
ncbi:hypothetical protein HNP99_001932 [Flavobacterium sp. 28A]|nr:hypothetical protein [Flavobacterium sp. 28A]